jgi:crotonobetainyl-CoA:carnitine CoA-transferase CaiB-like acyl-CoA transferase
MGVTVKLSDTPGAVRRAAPKLGEHNDEVLGVEADGRRVHRPG